MNTEELRAALRGATEVLETTPTFAGEVMRGGARRVRRRRLIVAGVAAATALAVGGTAFLSWQTLSEPAQVATDPRLKEPTRGNLATDSRFLDEVVQAWEEELPGVHNAGDGAAGRVIGRPHVFWAGTLYGDDAERTALVMQATRSAQDAGKQEVIRGVVATKPGTRKLGIVAAAPPNGERGYDYALHFGKYVLDAELDRGQFLSPGVRYDSMNRPSRKDTWRLMANMGGVMVGELPDDRIAGAVIVIGDPDQAKPEDQVRIVSGVSLADSLSRKQPTGLQWKDPGGQSHMMWAGTEPDRWQDMGVMQSRFHQVVKMSPLVDRNESHPDDPSPWYLSVGLPGGRIATVAEYQAPYDSQARIYVVTSDSADVSRLPGGGVSSAGQVDPAKPLPVLAQLPDNAGWAAAAKGATLSYRTTKDGAWLGERAGALLVPPGSVQVQVERPGQQPAIVDIP